MVFSGCVNAPASHCGNQGGAPYTTIAASPLIAEKPYITIDASGKHVMPGWTDIHTHYDTQCMVRHVS